jgi:NAD+ diphosphatase
MQKDQLLSPFALQKPFYLHAQTSSETDPSYWFIFHQKQLVLVKELSGYTIPCDILPPIPQENILYSRTFGVYENILCKVVEIDNSAQFSKRFTQIPFRDAYKHLSLDFRTIAGRGYQLLYWHRTNRFCGQCGNQMIELDHEPAKKCKACDLLVYPRLSPAVIMSVIRDDKILLGRSPHFPKGMYSPLAGFVEPGETLEEAVIREVHEEVGIVVSDIQYVTSQPWPFPQSLMMGFTTRFVSGELNIDKTELEDAQWFDGNNMPELIPSRISIARTLIDNFRHPST